MAQRTVVIDLAKNVFQLAVLDEHGVCVDERRLKRAPFIKFMARQHPGRVVMEACRASFHWGRKFSADGHTVALLPPHHTARFRLRQKTDRTDVAALIDADRSHQVKPVPVKSVRQQNIQHLHRAREHWQKYRVSYINKLRGMLGEYGLEFPQGARNFVRTVRETIETDAQLVAIRRVLLSLLDEIPRMEERIEEVERDLRELTKDEPVVRRLLEIPGIGPLGSTFMFAAVGDIERFAHGRSMASWLGLTPTEASSAERRRLGGISHAGNKTLRTLLVHGARAVLREARRRAKRQPETLSSLQHWALALLARSNFNKATVGLANKIVRIAWTVWKKDVAFERRMPAAA